MKGNIFIKRPVLAISISIVIVFIGLLALAGLPVEQFPNIAPPTVSVTTNYTGADADAVQKAVIMPLEEQINGVENMLYMTSTATNSGSATINVFFKQGTNADMAAVNVQNRVSRAQALLPQEVTRVGVQVTKRQTSFLQINALRATDNRYDEHFISNYLDINVIPVMRRIKGVGDVMMMGGQYSMRIWMDPSKMAQYNLMPSDITAVLAEQNLEAPTGSFGSESDNTYQINMKYTGRLKNIEEFKDIVISSKPDGTLLRLRDVADIELGAQSYAFHGLNDGKPAVAFLMFQVAGANSTETNQAITDAIEELKKDLPEGLEFSNMMSSNDFLFASIYNVEETLVIAILLVVLVVYFFLQDFRATIIPSISIIVSLIGTFACLQAAGFSINILTLFALVLAIGTVVDDAIVVVEAVQEKFDSGYTSSYLATKDAMSDITMAVITCTFVFMAVFIPVTFMGGTSGIFYTQFGVTMATSVGLSCICALTLCPALCAIMMRPPKENRKGKSINYYTKIAYNATYTVFLEKYKALITHVIKHRTVAWASLVITLCLLFFLIKNTNKGLVPQDDNGTIMVNITCPPGSSLEETSKIMDHVQDVIMAQDEIEHFQRIAGYSFMAGQGVSYGMYICRMKNWDDRPGMEHNASKVIERLNGILGDMKEATILCFQPGMIPGYGNGNMIELHLQDRTGGDMGKFYDYAKKFETELLKQPEVMVAMTSYARNYPQLQVEIDAAQCKTAGISPSAVLSVLGAYAGGAYVSNFNQFGKVYRVMIQADSKYRLDEQSIEHMYVRNGSQMAPISQFVTLRHITGPEIANRFNLFSSIQYNVMPMIGKTSVDAMDAIDRVFKENMPEGYGYEYGGMAREERESADSNMTLIIYCVCAFLILLILSSLYESFLVPWAVILSVPFGLMGSFLFAFVCNILALLKVPGFDGYEFSNNIYMQTGVIMLIGLLAKTAILITEFALDRRRKGMGIVESAYAAAVARLRPILMTVMTMIFGMIPLCLSSGAGANGNRSLGITVVGGMIVGTTALLFVVPVFYVFFEYLQEKIRPVEKLEVDDQFAKELEEAHRKRNEVKHKYE